MHGHVHDHGTEGHGQPYQHGPLVHRFQNAEEWAKEFDDPQRDTWQKPAEVVAAMQLEEGMTVADIGAGTGYFFSYLSKGVGSSGKVLALDIEPDMVHYMKERVAREGFANVEVRLVSPSDPGLLKGSINRILIVDTWHHIDQRASYATKLLEALAEGGAVCIVDFTLEAKQGPPKEHRLAPTQIVEELRQGGFAATVINESLPDQYIVVGKRP